MPSYHEIYNSHYSPEQLFGIIADVNSYQEFIPWVSGCRITDMSHDKFTAELMVKFKTFRGAYTSEVALVHPDSSKKLCSVEAQLVKGPFSQLNSSWRLTRHHDNSTEIELSVDFVFKSKLLDKMLSTMFTSATKQMIAAFEDRAKELYDKRV